MCVLYVCSVWNIFSVCRIYMDLCVACVVFVWYMLYVSRVTMVCFCGICVSSVLYVVCN